MSQSTEPDHWKEIKRLNHLYAVLSQMNQAVVRAKTREELFSGVCRIATEFGHFRLTWIGLLDAASGELTLVARESEHGFPHPIRAAEWAAARQALVDERPVICNAMSTDQSATDCRAGASEEGIGSFAAFPIRCQGPICGSLCLHAAGEGAFDTAEVKLLEEAALDISFALDKFEQEAKRSASEKRYRDLFENMLEGLAYCRMIFENGEPRDFLYLAANSAFERLTGLKDVVGKRVTELIPNIRQSDPELFEIYGRVARTGKPEKFERFVVALQTWFSVSVYSPEKEHFVAVFDVTTERKQAEQALLASERRLSLAMEATSDGLFDWEMGTGQSYFSPHYYKMLGFEPDELPASFETFAGLLHPDDRESTLAVIQEYNDRRRDNHQIEFRLRSKAGEWRWILSRGQVKRDTEGRTPRMVGTHVDITARKQAEVALRESESRFSSLFLHAPAIMCIAGIDDGRFLDVNEKFVAASGFSRDEAIGSTPPELGLLPEEEFAGHLDTFRKTGRLSVELCLRAKDGSPHPCAFEFVSIALGGTPHVLAIGLDISDWKRQEAEKRLLEEQLRQAQKLESIGRLAGGIAHDFNNLLTVINGYSAMMLGRMHSADPVRADIEEIQKAGERATALVRQLLAFSRRQVLQPEVLSLNAVVGEMEKMLPRLVGADVEIVTRLGPAPNLLMADRQQLAQVIMNLVVNARDAMPNGGTLFIETENVLLEAPPLPGADTARTVPHVKLTMRDTGTGMDEKTRLHLFEPFFTTKAAGKGTGLGLATVHGIVAQSGGVIEVESAPGSGTAFHIYFPAAEPAPVRVEAAIEPTPAGGTETILLVEDQNEVRRFAAAVLKRYGYRVIDVDSGEAALAECGTRRVDLLLTDVVMPRMSGVELVSRARQICSGLKTLFMSGYSDEVSERRGEDLSGENYLQKPFTAEGLAAKVREILGKPAAPIRILVVDDEPAVRHFVSSVLEGAGYEVSEAADGKLALASLSLSAADLVITDLVMPEKEGVETIQAIRRDYPGTKIIAMSGAGGGIYLRLTRPLGADSALAKPVIPEKLLAEVENVLGSRP